jgi:hypothetical protein
MNQALYTHMNNKRKKKKKQDFYIHSGIESSSTIFKFLVPLLYLNLPMHELPLV